MRSTFLLGVVCGLTLVAVGCGSSDEGDSDAVASNTSSAPPSPPGASAEPAAKDSEGGSAGGSADPGGAAGGGIASPNYPPGYGSSDPSSGSSGSSGTATGYPGTASPGGYPPPGLGGASAGTGESSGAEGYPGAAGANPGALGGYPGVAEGYPGSADGASGLAASKPPRPKTLREKAVDAFREGHSDEGVQLLSAHYLTNPTAGSELGRVMLWSPSLRKPALVTRIGVAVVYSSQPASYEGHPQPIGSPELEASLASLEQKADGKAEGGGRRVGGRRVGGRPNEGNAGGAVIPPGGPGAPGAEGGSGYGGVGGQNQMPASPQEELAYFTGEVGTKLLDKIKTKLESGAFGAIYREALKNAPLAVKPAGEGGEFGPGSSGPPGVGPGGIAMPPIGGGGVRGIGQPGREGGEGAGAGGQGGVVTGQLIAGVEFLGAAANVKELGELVKAAGVDAVIYFEVRVRPATANTFVNNDTRFRIVAASEMSKQLFSSAPLNNKEVHLTRKKRGAEDPVAKEIDNAIAALEANFKFVPLPALSPEQALKRLTFLLDQKPEDATSLLLEARLFVAKKLLKPDDAVTLVLTTVSEDQLAALSEVLEEGDVKEQIGNALSGKRADAPTSVLGKFGAALSGAGGLGSLVPTPQLPPMTLDRPPGGYPPAGSSGGYPGGPPAGYPGSAPGGSPPGGSAPPGLAPAGSGLTPAGSPAPPIGGRTERDR